MDTKILDRLKQTNSFSDDVPNYIISIAKILDNFQGGINTIRSNSTWLSELISQFTDQMRNFDASQKKLDAKFDVILDKVTLLNMPIFIYTYYLILTDNMEKI